MIHKWVFIAEKRRTYKYTLVKQSYAIFITERWILQWWKNYSFSVMKVITHFRAVETRLANAFSQAYILITLIPDIISLIYRILVSVSLAILLLKRKSTIFELHTMNWTINIAWYLPYYRKLFSHKCLKQNKED